MGMPKELLDEYVGKCDEILKWAEEEDWFDTGLVESVRNNVMVKRWISGKQMQAIDNILKKCVHKNDPAYAGVADDGELPF
jgi:hypothetical protein